MEPKTEYNVTLSQCETIVCHSLQNNSQIFLTWQHHIVYGGNIHGETTSFDDSVLISEKLTRTYQCDSSVLQIYTSLLIVLVTIQKLA